MTEVSQSPQQAESVYPENFSFEESEKMLYGEVSLDERLVQLRKSAIYSREVAIKNKMEYFILDLGKIPYVLKQTFIKELSEKFPYIGYRYEDTQVTVLDIIFQGENNGQLPKRYRVRMIKNFQDVPESDKYVVALTRRFASTMETYSW